MKICPYKALSVLESALLSTLRTCPADSSGSACCTALLTTPLAPQTHTPKDELYHTALTGYWRLDNQQIYPSCIFRPQTPSDISLALSTLLSANDNTPTCTIALKSGGHSTVIGSTNAEHAVTIDLSLLNSTAYNPETQIASVGPGARWKGVYEELNKYEVAVPGGRGGTVGVGGFITGGGNSFHSARFGFTCDAVVDFEIILPNSTVTSANATFNPRLFRALKGGSGNFGIVTRFDILTFPLPKHSLWGGIVTYDHASTVESQVNALVKFTDNVHTDPAASLIPLYTYNSKLGRSVIVNSFVYTTPGVSFPEAFGDFYKMDNFSDTTRWTGLDGLVGELEPESGLHNDFYTLTFANSPSILHKAIAIQDRMILEAKKVVKSENWSIISLFQPLPALFAKIGNERGGNVLGLSEDKNHILDLLWLTWDNPLDDSFFNWVGKTYISELESFAGSVGGDHPYIYLNYAGADQNPLRSYGEENLAFLQSVAGEVDPEGVFQEVLPWGFKVSQA
ncbi:FAD-binding oxidoreductase [Aspergillus stella-maris]|uniref:FAD-binding oxidoreductase n=1 Tax=Aspergillus stella-maris TaxID=1810926 RepID=UPI003CCDDB88